MRAYEAVIWDIDGTLLNTMEGLSEAYRHCIRELNLPAKRDDELAGFIGPVPQEIFRREFGLMPDEAQRATDVFRTWYKEHGLCLAYPYAGVIDTLRQLKYAGILQAVATNKRQDYAVEICELFGITPYCSPILGPNNTSTKTKADLIRQCVRVLSTQKVIMIGDTPGDAQAAAQAGVDFLGVNYGFGFQEVPGYANTPSDIIKHIL